MLLGLIVAIFLILLVLSVAAPRMAQNLRRDRDVEAVHRGNQYVRGIRQFYIKNGNRYPATMEQLEKTNNIRFLRQRYKDPITGKDDWRTIPVGQNKTTVKGFFGQPLTGLATTGLGSVAGMASPGIGQTPAAGPGAAPGAGGAFGANGAAPGAAGGAGGPGASGPGATGAAGSTGAFGSSTSPGGIGSQSATAFSGSSQPFMGVGLDVPGDSIVELNEQTTYATWEFLYDPRIEQLKAKAGLNSGGTSVGAGSLGQTPGSLGNPNSPNPTSSPGGATVPSPPTVGAPMQPIVGVPVQP
jgi:type II secretory pathway pseudopilin PulG